MIVVLEGPDFAGKSTLAGRLAERFGGSVNWVGPPPEQVRLVQYYFALIEQAADSPGLVVFDRLHISELVYGPIFRGVSRLSFEEARVIDDRLDTMHVVKVHVDAADSVLVGRFRGPRGDDLVDGEDRLLEVARAYRRLLGGGAELRPWPKRSLESLLPMVEAGVE